MALSLLALECVLTTTSYTRLFSKPRQAVLHEVAIGEGNLVIVSTDDTNNPAREVPSRSRITEVVDQLVLKYSSIDGFSSSGRSSSGE